MRIDTSRSPGSSAVIRVMSSHGPMKKSRAAITRSPLAVADDHLRVERDQRRRGVRRADRDAAIGLEDRMLAIDRRRRVGVADVAAGAVARPAGAVVVAPRVLADVAADRSLIADLRRGDDARRLRQQRGTSRCTTGGA